jgi:uncharacterized protein with beta-barrel porin domain
MSYFSSWASFRRRASFSCWQILRLGAALAAALLLPLAAANAFPASSAVCVPSPYTAGDLTCTNAGTITTSVIDGIDAVATGGNATTTNSGTVNTSGGNLGIFTSTDVGNATTTNTGAVNVSGGGTFGIWTQSTSTGDATTTNQGSVINNGTGYGILTGANNGNATTNNFGTVTVTGFNGFQVGDSPGGVIGASFGSNFGIMTSTGTGNATTNNYGNVTVNGTSDNVGIFTATNFGFVTQFAGNTLPASSTATTNNYGNVSVRGDFSFGILTSSGAAATTNNYHSVSVVGIDSIGIYTTAATVATAPATSASLPLGTNATTTNYGTVSVDGTVITVPFASPSLGAPLSIGGGNVGIYTASSFGNATTINGGIVNVTGLYNTGIETSTNIGTATTINAGTVNVVVAGSGLAPGVCGGACGSGTGIWDNSTTGNAVVINSGTISVSGANSIGVLLTASGTSLLVNSGTISAPGGIAVQFANPLDPDTLTLQPGSFIIGAINLIGVGDTVNVNAGNQNLTFNTLAGATISGSVPYVVSGNRIVSVDPTGFAVTDRGLMDFTRAVSASLGGRINDATASGGIAAAAGGALGFAGYDDSASRFEDAFAQVMGYAKAPDSAVLFKNPTMTTPDGTTVWAKGFYGQRIQQADGPVLRNVTNFYGGAIGADRLVRPDLRLGGFLGGGAINTSIDLNSGSATSDVVFAGVYGRKDLGRAFIDFALLAGHTGNNTTRNINNNLLANGLEIATASFGGWFFSPEVAAGYRYDVAPGWTVTPAARLRYLAANYDGFTETGSTANLTAGSRTLQNAEERGDLTLTRTALSEVGRFQIGLTAGVLGQQRTGSGTVNATLLGQALAFATPGKSSIGGGYGGVSLDWRTKNGVSLFAAAEYTAMTDSSNTVTGKAGLRYGF